MVIAASGKEERARITPHRFIEAQRAVVKRLCSRADRPREGARRPWWYLRGRRPIRRLRPPRSYRRCREARSSSRARRPGGPGGAGPVCIDLDPKAVRVAQVQRFADRVVGHARSQTQTQHVCRKTPERHSVGQEQAKCTSRTCHATAPVQHPLLHEAHQRPLFISHAEQSRPASRSSTSRPSTLGGPRPSAADR